MSRTAKAPIVLERVFRFGPETVFDAWSDPKSLAHWMAPGSDFGRAEVEVDFRVGGAFRIVMHAGAGEYAQHGEYLEIDPPKRLVFTWVSEWLPPAEAATRVTVTFEPNGADETRLRMVHDELPAGSGYDGHAEGWDAILAGLERHLEDPT